MEVDTENAATSQLAVPAAREVIQLDDDDQRPPTAVTEPVVSEVPVATIVVVTAPPVSSVVVTTTPTGLPSSVPVVSAAASGLMSPATVYTTHRVPEDQTGAAKDAMIQAGLMKQQARGAYDTIVSMYNNNVVLEENVRKACEIGLQYAQVESKKNKLKLECDAMKKLLEDKDVTLANVKQKSEADELKLVDLEKLKAENEQMKKERDEWAKRLHSMSKRGNALEGFVKDFLANMLDFLIEFCPDFQKEIFEVEPFLDPIKFPVPDDLAVNMYRLNCCLVKVQGSVVCEVLWKESTKNYVLKTRSSSV
ncbi:hypothetical protein ZWY2020_006228 [Hordeum vulgare]|nr:hypothetical protein ZWY2020_006228 [Hordeum vulgare]